MRVSVSVSGGDCRFDSPSPRPFEHPVSANLRQRLATSAGRTWTAVLGVRRLNSRDPCAPSWTDSQSWVCLGESSRHRPTRITFYDTSKQSGILSASVQYGS